MSKMNPRYTDCDALADFVNALSYGAAPWDLDVLMGMMVPQDKRTNALGIASNPDSVLFQSDNSGFLPQFPNTPGDTSDQAHHFAAFFQLGFSWGNKLGSAFATVFESAEATINWFKGLGFDVNQGDINLGAAAAKMGDLVARGKMKPTEVSSAIRSSLCAH
jgi:hypothetical protein